MEATSLRFAAAARTLGQTARRGGLVVPGFRSPPRLAGADRSLRRTTGGHFMVAIRLRGRPWMAVVSDMVEGVIATNRLVGPEADAARRMLWSGLEREALLSSAPLTLAERPAPSHGRARSMAARSASPPRTLPVTAVPARTRPSRAA